VTAAARCALAAGLGLFVAAPAPAQTPPALPLPPGEVVIGPVFRRDGSAVPSITTGADANVYIFSTPPTQSFVDAAPAAAVRTSAPTQFVRFYTEGVTQPVGGFIAGTNVVRGLAAAEVKDVLALPFLPTSYTLVTVPSGTCILVAQGAPILGSFPANPPSIPAPGPWGRGGVPQALLIGTSASPNCADPQFLPAADYRNRQAIGAAALDYTPLAGGGNSGAVAGALDRGPFPAPFSDMDRIYDRLDLINIGSPDALRAALTQLAGVSYANVASVQMQGALVFLDALSERLRGGGPGGAWVRGMGGFGRLSGSDGAQGFDLDIGGVAFGFDLQVLPELLVGAAAGFSRASTGTMDLAESGRSDLYAAAVYGRYRPGRVHVDAAMGYGYSDIGMSRSIQFPGVQRHVSGDGDGSLLFTAVELAYPLALGTATTLTPLAGGQALRAGKTDFTETGAGAVNLRGTVDDAWSLRGILGATPAHRVAPAAIPPLTLSARLAWAHDFADTGRSASAAFEGLPGATFTVEGARVPRDSVLVGLGLGARINGLDLFARYDGGFATGYALQGFAAGLTLRF